MEEKGLERLTEDELLEAMSDRLDQISEAEFDPAEMDAYLDALNKLDPVASDFDPEASQRAFREKHGALFQEPKLRVVPTREEGRPRGRRIPFRAAALAAAMVAVCAVAAGAVGLTFLGKWGRGEFWFPGTNQAQGIDQAERPALVTGEFDTMQAALDANGVTLPLAPARLPDGFRADKAQVSQEAQSALFEAEYRDGAGHSYTLSLTRADHRSATGRAKSFGIKGMTAYVADGVSYYLSRNPDGTVWCTWFREDWSCELSGDLDRETAMALCRSIGEGKGYTAPSAGYEPLGNELANMLEVSNLDPNLAPTWLPEGFVKSDINSMYGGIDDQLYGVHAVYDDVEAQRKLVYHVEWWEDPAEPVPPVFAWDVDGFETYSHNGVTFRIGVGADKALVTWLDGHVSGYLWGDLSVAEARAVVDSIPEWSNVKPEPDHSGHTAVEVERKKYDSLAEAVADSGLDAGLVPGWLPEGYALENCETADLLSWFDLSAAYTNGAEQYLMFHVTRYEDGDAASQSATYIKDDKPVVEYEHNGVTYAILTNGEFRNIVWKDGDLEGSIGGPISLEEAKQIVDSLGYSAAE